MKKTSIFTAKKLFLFYVFAFNFSSINSTWWKNLTKKTTEFYNYICAGEIYSNKETLSEKKDNDTKEKIIEENNSEQSKLSKKSQPSINSHTIAQIKKHQILNQIVTSLITHPVDISIFLIPNIIVISYSIYGCFFTHNIIILNYSYFLVCMITILKAIARIIDDYFWNPKKNTFLEVAKSLLIPEVIMILSAYFLTMHQNGIQYVLLCSSSLGVCTYNLLQISQKAITYISDSTEQSKIISNPQYQVNESKLNQSNIIKNNIKILNINKAVNEQNINEENQLLDQDQNLLQPEPYEEDISDIKSNKEFTVSNTSFPIKGNEISNKDYETTENNSFDISIKNNININEQKNIFLSTNQSQEKSNEQKSPNSSSKKNNFFTTKRIFITTAIGITLFSVYYYYFYDNED